MSPALLSAAMSSLLIGATGFFRDADVFESLRLDVMPSIGRRRGAVHALSAGCSDGSELYSLAILLVEAGLLEGSYLLGIDCRPESIQKARAGSYEEVSLRRVARGRLERHFEKDGPRFRIDPAIRARIRWKVEDLLEARRLGLWDLILFRNTAMYMRTEAVEPLWQRLEAALRPGGFLVTGRAERPAGVTRLVPRSPCIYERARR